MNTFHGGSGKQVSNRGPREGEASDLLRQAARVHCGGRVSLIACDNKRCITGGHLWYAGLEETRARLSIPERFSFTHSDIWLAGRLASDSDL